MILCAFGIVLSAKKTLFCYQKEQDTPRETDYEYPIRL